MATSKKAGDRYPNIINITVTETAANTLTFQDANIGFSAFDRVGLMIHRIEYYPENSVFNEMVADTDFIHFGLSASNQIDSLNASERAIIDTVRIKANLRGTAANLFLVELPVVRDYSDLPGGGLLVAPRPLYAGCVGNGLGNAHVIQVRIYFTTMKMSDSDYFELLESRQFYGA